MLIDKEYPATHSMSTAWYMVDDDGNVGIMEFDDNGPVPLCVREENYIGCLLFGEGFFDYDFRDVGIHLTKEQIEEILVDRYDPEDENGHYWNNVAVKIDKSQEKEFLQLCKKPDIEYNGCISKELGLYLIGPEPCADAYPTIKTMLKSKMILNVYKIPECDTDLEYVDGKLEVEKNFNQLPYYVYREPYWIDYTQKRINVPKNPVKISQFAPEFRDYILRIPGRFEDMPSMQIAQWFPSKVHGLENKMKIIDHCGYNCFPLDDGGRVYTAIDPFMFYFCEYYPFMFEEDLDYKKCNKCYRPHFCMLESTRPTVMVIADVKYGKRNYFGCDFKKVKSHIISIPYLPEFQCKEDRSDYNWRENSPLYKPETLREIFQHAHGWIEEFIQYINPQVIILDDDALDVVSTVYNIADHEVNICGTTYPIYFLSELNDNIEEIKKLAKKPYRGFEWKYSYTQEEMDELIKKGLAK